MSDSKHANRSFIAKMKKRIQSRPVLYSVLLFAVVAAVVVVTLWLTGVWRRGFSFLPKREYILAPKAKSDPQTLADLLHIADPGTGDLAEILLAKPEIADELLAVSSLEELVDSRVSLNNLREIEQGLKEKKEELVDPDLVVGAVERTGASPDSATAVPAAAAIPDGALIDARKSLIDALLRAAQELLAPAEPEEYLPFPEVVNIKTVWQNPDEALIHLTPSGGWMPEKGYQLYRTIGGKKELIAEGLADPNSGKSGQLVVPELVVEGENLIPAAYKQADLSADKQAVLGMTRQEFNAFVYRADTFQPKKQVSGKADFQTLRGLQITIPSETDQKVPETDFLLDNPVLRQGYTGNSKYNVAEITSVMRRKMTLQPSMIKVGAEFFLDLPAGEDQFDTANEVLNARQQLTTLSFVNDDFAEAAGFLYRDSLAELHLPVGTEVLYTVEGGEGIRSMQTVTTGLEVKLSKPVGLEGYGLDGLVPLRWEQATDEAETRILSGYNIERKIKGESSFQKINTEPVTISYILDETDIYFESPIFFEDGLANGETAEYRVCSLDIFGRQSEYSDPLVVKVEKVTPPDAPAIDAPILSGQAAGDADPGTDPGSQEALSEIVLQTIAVNKGKNGAVVPIFLSSPDTERFVVYRAVAEGIEPYSKPQVLANIKFDKPELTGQSQPTPAAESGQTQESGEVKYIKDKYNKNYIYLLENGESTDPTLVYFDADIKEGHTYKYWVSAWDSWDNESAWSRAASVAVRSEKAPQKPADPEISMLARALPDLSTLAPGIEASPLISKEDQQTYQGQVSRAFSDDVNLTIVSMADQVKLPIGSFTAAEKTVHWISPDFDNLPKDKYIHLFTAVAGEDVLPDGTARIKWPAYSGDGLEGYLVYSPEFEALPLDQMQKLTRDELAAMGAWRLVNEKATEHNTMVISGLDGTAGTFNLFLICLKPEGGDIHDLKNVREMLGKAVALNPDLAGSHSVQEELPEAGFVRLVWEPVKNPQIKYYRIYKSEVPSFKKEIDESKLEWTLIADQLDQPFYSDPVDQSFAHYYYYKVTAVTMWGVESPEGAVKRFRVPATKPPQTPNLLLPLSRKDGVAVNFSAVNHCDRYVIYRVAVPKPTETELASMIGSAPTVFNKLFRGSTGSGDYINSAFKRSLIPGLWYQTPGAAGALPVASFSLSEKPLMPMTRFKTVAQLDSSKLFADFTAQDNLEGLQAVDLILDLYGPLAIAEYRDLSRAMLPLVKWEVIGELPVDEDTVEQVDPATGLKKPLSFIDHTAKYGITYLYTVQAWNDDNLGSTRAEPVEATPRRNRPFDPLEGLSGKVVDGQPELTWDEPKMENLTADQCRQDTVGYFVYRSEHENGTYYQASPLLFDRFWRDTDCDPYGGNWYKVRVLDTGGYLSEFSEPLYTYAVYVNMMDPVIPDDPPIPSSTPTPSIPPTPAPTMPPRATPTLPPRPTPTPSHTPAPTPTVDRRAPRLEDREDEYSFNLLKILNRGLEEALYATGEGPLIWSLEPIAIGTAVPEEAVISSEGTLFVRQSIAVGEYTFKVRVENAYGRDERTIRLRVRSGLIAADQPEPAGQTVTVVRLAQISNQITYRADTMKCMGFWLHDVNLTAPANIIQFMQVGYSGHAKMQIGDSLMPVAIKGGSIEKVGSNKDILASGRVYIEEEFEATELGLHIASLILAPEEDLATVDGYLQSPDPERSIAGNRYVIEFSGAEIRPGHLVIQRDAPSFIYEQFTVKDVESLWINIQPGIADDDEFISFYGGTVDMKFHLETLAGEELTFIHTGVHFDFKGRLNGYMQTAQEQTLRLPVPGGSGLRVSDAFLAIVKGAVTEQSYLLGDLLLPFEQADAQGAGVPGTYVGREETNHLDVLAAAAQVGKLPGTKEEVKALHESLQQFGERAQQKGLLVVPEDPKLQDLCAFISVEVHGWSGEGFVIPATTMSSVSVAERSLEMDLQRDQGIVVEATGVSLDLDRTSFLAKSGSGMTPNETQEDFWVGAVIQGGTVVLPPSFVKTNDDETIRFDLAEGEMIYDLNGFNYQTFLYSDEGVPANFGESLGGFEDVWVYDCLLDLYANQVNLEINAEVALGAFLNNRVKAKLYTNQEDNANGKKGQFLCSVAPTEIRNCVSMGVHLTIDGGWFRADGVHLDGAYALDTDEVQTEEPLQFSDLIIPAQVRYLFDGVNPDNKYGHVMLDQPVGIDFQGFLMEVREVSLQIKPLLLTKQDIIDDPEKAEEITFVSMGNNWLTLHGATLLAENIALSDHTTDDLIIECQNQPMYDHSWDFVRAPRKTQVLYESSYSVLSAGFDGCVDVVGVLVPLPTGGGGASGSAAGLVEFDASQLDLCFLEQLDSVSITTHTRFGYDMDQERCYFAIGVTPDAAGNPINFGAGNVRDFTGALTYNMVMEKGADGHYDFPADAKQMQSYIEGLPVSKQGQPSFAAAIKGDMLVFGLCEVRDLYFAFEEGPRVHATGDLYLPLQISAMVSSNSDAFVKVGSTEIIYSHPQKYFSFSMTLDRIDVAVAALSGSLGFEYSPRLFGVYVGYPETLAGKISIFHVGLGVGFRIDQDGDSLIKFKIEMGLDESMDIAIVYLRGYIYVGVEGAYYFGPKTVTLELYLKGGLEGGIRVGSKRFNIISFYLDASGKLTSSSPYTSWRMDASCKVSYSLNLWLVSVSGSVTARFDTTLG